MLDIGTSVRVLKDNGNIFTTKTRSEPWMASPSRWLVLLPSRWLVLLDGVSDGYDCRRVTPIKEEDKL